MHADEGMHEVLRQVLEKIRWTFTVSGPRPVRGGWQADITLSSSTTSVRIFGETFYTAYMARDSAYIYALDYVDRFLGINIIDVNYTLYLPMIHGLDVNDPRF